MKENIKRRSRGGCHNCKRLKIKCDETKPSCSNCIKTGCTCDYSIKLSWGGRSTKNAQLYSNPATSNASGANFRSDANSTQGSIKFMNVDFSSARKPKRKVNHINSPRHCKQPKLSLTPELSEFENMNTPELQGFTDELSSLERITTDNIPGLQMLDDMLQDTVWDQSLRIVNSDDYSFDEEISKKYEHDYCSHIGKADNLQLWNRNFDKRDYPSSNEENDSDICSIPPKIDALPDILLNVPAYRELFHFFIHHTADCLVPIPSAYPDNPFKGLLPQMALSTPHLLCLVVAYGASHRAMFLGRPQPTELIDRLMSRILDGLMSSLQDETQANSDTTLATAVMLCSFYVINTSTDHTSWTTHLQGARNIVRARGLVKLNDGGTIVMKKPNDNSSAFHKGVSPDDSPIQGPQPLRTLRTDSGMSKIGYFLLRVLAYLDVLGSLSSSTGSSLLSTTEDVSSLWSVPFSMNAEYVSYEEIDSIDVLLGFEINLIPVYSKVGSLIRRRNALSTTENNDFHTPEWNLENEKLLSDALMLSQLLLSCANNTDVRRRDIIRRDPNNIAQKLTAMSLLFTYAVTLHLYRRVLLLDSDAESVRHVVSCIMELLDSAIPLGSPMEACLAFPLVTTACETNDPEIRRNLMIRLRGMARFGIGHVEQATELVEICWKKNKTWAQVLEERNLNIVLA